MGDKNTNVQEAAARLKVRSGRMGSNSSLSLSGRPERQESRDLLTPTLLTTAEDSVQMLAVDLMQSAPMMPLEILNGGQPTKAEPEELKMPTPPSLRAPLSSNLIDFSDPTPVLLPPSVQSKPMISPRWIIPAAATAAPLQPEGGALTPALHPRLSSQMHNVMDTSVVAQPPKEHGMKHKGLLTTEL